MQNVYKQKPVTQY